MKVFILFCIVAVSQANLLHDLLEKLPEELKQKETELLQNLEKEFGHLLNAAGKRNLLDDLKKFLEEHPSLLHFPTVSPGVDFPFTVVAKRDSIPAVLEGHINDEIQAFLEKIKESIDGAETIATNLEAKLKAAEAGLKNGQDIKVLAQMVLDTLEKDIASMVAKGTFDVDLEKMVNDIVPSAVAKLVSKHSRRGLIADLLNGLKDTLTDTVGLLSGTAFGDLKTFFENVLGTAGGILTQPLGNLKNLAAAFLANAGKVTANVAAEAVKFFAPFQNQLGGLFTQIKALAEKLGANLPINVLAKRDSIPSVLEEHISDEIHAFLEKIKQSIEGAETIATNLEANLKAAEAGLKNGSDVKSLAQMLLDTLEKDIASMVAKGTFEVDLEKMISDIVPSAVAKLVSKHSRRGLLGDLLNGLKDTFTDTLGLLSGTAFGDFKTFLENVAGTAAGTLTQPLGNLKNLAEAFLANAGTATANVAAEAVKFFAPFQNQLGGLYTKIKNVTATLAGKLPINLLGKRDSISATLEEHINDEIHAFLEKIKESVEGAEKIATNLEANLKAAEAGLKNGQDIKALAQMVLETLEKDMASMVAKGTFDVDLEKMVNDIVPSAVAKLVVSKHSRRGLIGDLLNGLKDTFTDTLGLLSGTAFGDLKTFLGNFVGTAAAKLTQPLGNLKNLAAAFLTNAGTATANVAAEAVKFFAPFQNQLGGLFTKIKNVAATLAGHATN